MKKTIITLSIILGIAIGASAQNGGLFGKGPSRGSYDEYYNDYYGTRDGVFSLPLATARPTTKVLPSVRVPCCF